MPEERHTRWMRRLGTAAAASFVLALLFHAYLGSFTRYISDDWCLAGVLHSEGLSGFLVRHYLRINWSGQFSAILAAAIAERLGGVRLVPFLPAAGLALWLAALTWMLLQFGLAVRLRHPALCALLLAGTAIFVTLENLYNTAQPDPTGYWIVVHALYWRLGMFGYVAPLILLALYAGLIGRSLRQAPQTRPGPAALALGVILPFAAGGASVIYAAGQVGALAVAGLIGVTAGRHTPRRGARALILAGLAGAVPAALVAALAPANHTRLATHFAPPLDPPSLVKFLVANSVHLAHFTAGASQIPMATALVIPALLAVTLHPREPGPDARRLMRLLTLVPAAGFLCIMFAFAPATYVSTIPARILVIPQFILVSTVALCGYLAGLLVRSTPAAGALGRPPGLVLTAAVVALLLVLGPYAFVRRALDHVPRARAFAALWDERDRAIRAAGLRGHRRLLVPALDNLATMGEIGPDPNHWLNECAAKYYGLESIVARASRPQGQSR